MIHWVKHATLRMFDHLIINRKPPAFRPFDFLRKSDVELIHIGERSTADRARAVDRNCSQAARRVKKEAVSILPYAEYARARYERQKLRAPNGPLTLSQRCGALLAVGLRFGCRGQQAIRLGRNARPVEGRVVIYGAIPLAHDRDRGRRLDALSHASFRRPAYAAPRRSLRRQDSRRERAHAAS